MNDGMIKADKSSLCNERYTPFYAVRPLLQYLPKDKIIWCPFDEDWSAFVKVLREEGGLTVINSSLDKGQNFFDFEPDEWDIIVSNPPFSKKKEVFERLTLLGKPYALLLPLDTLQGNCYFKYFRDSLQLLIFDERTEYFQYPDFEKTKRGVAFTSAYFCKDLLPRDLIISPLNKVHESLMSPAEAEKYNLSIRGKEELSMFDY